MTQEANPPVVHAPYVAPVAGPETPQVVVQLWNKGLGAVVVSIGTDADKGTVDLQPGATTTVSVGNAGFAVKPQA